MIIAYMLCVHLRFMHTRPSPEAPPAPSAVRPWCRLSLLMPIHVYSIPMHAHAHIHIDIDIFIYCGVLEDHTSFPSQLLGGTTCLTLLV